MKALGSLLIAILFGIGVIWLLIELLGAALKLVAILIGIGIAVIAYFIAEKLVRSRT
ncbi:MAG: hypothetical protein PGN09_04900 [Sphingomonas fennica]